MLPAIALHERPDLLPGEVHVWHVSLTADAAYALSPEERATALRFRQPVHQQRYTAARGQLRLLLADYLHTTPSSIRLAYGPFGKPQLADPAQPLHFNISHSGDSALIAITKETEVGVDLEAIRDVPERERIAAIYFSAAERAALAALPTAAQLPAFFRTWVRLEAHAKAIGRGIALQGDTAGNPPTPTYTITDLHAPPGYAAALALASPATHIDQWELKSGRR